MILKKSKFTILLSCFLLILLSGCSAYQHKHYTFSHEKLKKLTPHYVSVKNGFLEYYEFGKGSPIVLIPGYATDISSWNKKFLTALAEHHHIILLNNRNVGGSVIKSSRYETKDLANDISQLITNLNLKKPALLGISMGGMIAQQFAILNPDKLNQLILINTAIAGMQAVPPASIIEKKILNLPLNKLGRYIIALELFFPSSSRMQMAYALATDRFQPENFKEIDSKTVMPKQRDLILKWVKDNATGKQISEMKLPVLILNGEADIVIPPVNSLILRRAIPKAQLVRWKDGGHAMIYQYPEQIARTICDFISETT